MASANKLHSKKRNVFVFGICLILVSLCYITFQTPAMKLNIVVEKEKPENISYILIITDKKWILDNDRNQSYFEELNCPVTSCVVTKNQSLLPDTTNFDAVLLASEMTWNSLHLPSHRTDNQVYIAATMESPFLVKSMKEISETANWTMTYRLDADVPWLYGSIYDSETQELVAPILDSSPNWKSVDKDEFSRRFFEDSELSELIRGKKKHAAWMVSNCNPSSNRMQLAKSLQKYIPVDIYGRCGTLKCPKSDKCYELLEENYLFYFAFENAICKDYITEKTLSTMNYYIVPVVYGGADYTKFLPPGSYIDTAQFNTTTELAEYLLYLADHPEEYVKYFWWKEHYYIQGKTYCNLCEKVHKWSIERKPIPHRNMDAWFRKDICYEHPIKIS